MSTDSRNPGWPYRKSGDRGQAFSRLERLVRIVALLILCSLVWYFSYDHGRSSSGNRIQKLELENLSLREKLVLAENELEIIKESLSALQVAPDPKDLGFSDSKILELSSTDNGQANRGTAAQGTQELPEPSQVGDSQAEYLEVLEAESSVSSSDRSASLLTPSDRKVTENPFTDHEDSETSSAVVQTTPIPPEDQSASRLTLRSRENKAAFGDKAILTLAELDIINPKVTIRIQHADSGRRESRVMEPGDIIEFDLSGQRHSLYLDQIRGNLAFFILDGLPGASTHN